MSTPLPFVIRRTPSPTVLRAEVDDVGIASIARLRSLYGAAGVETTAAAPSALAN